MPNNKNNKFISLLPYLVLLLFLVSITFMNPLGSRSKTLSYSEFMDLLATDKITDATVSVNYNTSTIQGEYTVDGKTEEFTVTVPNTEQVLEKLEKENIEVVDANQSNFLIDFITALLPVALFVGFGYFMLRNLNNAGGGQKQAFDFSKSRARLESEIKVRFADVAGCDEEKEEMAEIIEYLKTPRKFAKMGARIPKGILMVGNPGTGKTLLAKAVAGEANVPFYSISGSDFVEMFVGVGASRVRDMFKKAKSTAPCMIFIDEIDAVGRQRGAGMGGGNDEREQTLNQLLVEMDGMADNSGIVVIAATNRPDVLDPALLRPGRFDRQITVALPDKKGREAILKVHARNKHLAEDVNLGALATRTPGFSGADLENVLNEAAILAVRENKTIISMENVDEAIDRVMMGPAKKSRTYDDKTKKLVAYHEAGHAIVGLNLPEGSIVQKVTIIPRGNAGGYNLIMPRKERMLNTRKELIETITSYMGGRAAEEIFFDDITTGASSDIEQATKIAKDMVTLYGMSELGPVQYDRGSQNVFLGRDYNSPMNTSSQIAFEIDKEVRKIVDYCHDLACKIINEHKDDLIKLAEALMANETLTAEEINDLMANRLELKDGKLVKTGFENENVVVEEEPKVVETTEEVATTNEDTQEKEAE